jgi:hypothetical protein
MTWDSSVGLVTSLRAVRASKHGLIPGWNREFSLLQILVFDGYQDLSSDQESGRTVKRLLVA